MKLQLLKISRGPGGWIGSVRGKTVNRLHQVNKAAVSLRAKIHKKMYFEKIIVAKKLYNKLFAP